MGRFAFALVLLALLAASATAAEVVEPSAVAVGAHGICLTELDGGELAEIPVTVIGTVAPAAPEGEMVLIRLDDERIARLGVAAGMSGSPVYVDGKLLGALAFGWAFAKEPIAGVTPFVRMLDLEAETTAPVAGVAAARPPLAEIMGAAHAGTLGRRVLDWLVTPHRAGASPLPLNLSVGGVAPTLATDWLAEGFQRLGWLSAPLAGGTTAEEGEIRPGAMVAGVLAEGDATVAVGGTVTEVRGDRVWAFGHPFLGGGSLALPLATARVVTVLPSLAASFKVFNVGRTVGAFQADRSRGVWGRLGGEAPMVNVEVDANGRAYRFRCVRHPLLLPLLSGYLTYGSHAARGRTFGEQTVASRIELTYAGGQRVTLEETLASADAAAGTAALVTALLGYLQGSPYAVPQVETVKVSLSTREQLERADVVDATAERTRVRPGQRLGVRVRLHPFRGDIVSRRLEIQVPPGAAAGRMDLIVADGAAWTAYDLQMRPLRPASFDDELRLVGRLVPSTRLVLALETPAPGVALPGVSTPVPPSVLLALRSGLGAGLEATAHQVVGRVVEEFPFQLSGAQRIPLQVVDDSRTPQLAPEPAPED